MASVRANARKIVCIGRNYADHITELSSARPSQPFFFLKPSSSIVPPKTGPILLPKGVNVHHEIELGLIIAKPPAPHTSFKNLPISYAAGSKFSWTDVVKSYVLAIDLTARNVQNEAKKKGLPWSIAKGFDTFCPISAVIPKEKIPDPHDATLYLSVNGQTKQRDSTNLMLFDIPRILSDISKVMALEEGDLILTGTPKGVGPVKAGDKIVCGIEVDGQEVEEGSIEIEAVDAPGEEEGGYVFKET